MAKKNGIAHIALLCVAVIYGANYTIAKLILDPGYLKPEALVLVRIITGLALFSLIHQVFIREKVAKEDWKRMALCGLFGVALNQMFFLIGLRNTTPIHASLIMTTTPILVLVIASILATERFTKRKALGVLIGMGGAAWLIIQSSSSTGAATFFGDLAIFINAASYGIYLVLVGELMKKYHPFTVVRWVFTFGFIYVLPFSIQSLWHTDWAVLTPVAWKALSFVLILSTFLVYLLNTFALGIVKPSTVSVYIYLQPLIAGGISIGLGKEVLSWEKIIAGTLIFLGVYLVSTRWRGRTQKV